MGGGRGGAKNRIELAAELNAVKAVEAATSAAKKISDVFTRAANQIQVSFQDLGINKAAANQLIEAAGSINKLESALKKVKAATEGIELDPEFANVIAVLDGVLDSARETLGGLRQEAEQLPPIFDKAAKAFRDVATGRFVKAPAAGLFPDISKLEQTVQAQGKIQLAAEGTNKAIAAGVPIIDRATQSIQNFGKVQEEAAEKGKARNFGVPDISGADKAIQAQGKLQSAAEETNKVVAAGVPVVSQADKAIQSFGVTAGKAAETLRQFNLAPADKQTIQLTQDIIFLIRVVSEAERAFPKLKRGIEEGVDSKALKRYADAKTRLAELRGEAGKGPEKITLFGRALDGVSKKFEKFGFNVRDVAVILGAGFAGGLAGIFQVTEKVVRALSDFIGEQHALAIATEKTFRSSATEIENFATSTASSLGASRNEILKTAASFEQLRRELQFPAASAESFAKALTLIAEQAFHAQGGFKDVEEASAVVAAALQGDEKAFARLGITMAELARISTELFGKLPDRLTAAESAIFGVEVATRKAIEDIRQFGLANKTLGAIVQDIFRGVAGHVDTASKAFKRAQADLEGIDTRSLPQRFLDLVSGAELLNTSINSLRENIRGLSDDQLLLLRSQARAASNKDAVKAIDAELKKRNEVIAAIEREKEAFEASTNAVEQNIAAFLASTDAIERAIDAQRTLNLAREDGARRVLEAEERVHRAFQDAARRQEEVGIQTARSIEDARVRAIEAEREFVDAQIESARRREDSEERVVEAREQAARSIRTAEERLGDFELDHTRKVEDLQRRIREAHRQTRNQSIEALIDLQQAIRRGTGLEINEAARRLASAREEQGEAGALADAQRELAREQEDFARERGRLERDLREERLDAIRNIDKAVREQQRAEVDGARQIEKAQAQINEARKQQTRALEDAGRAVRNLRIENVRAVEDAIKGVHDAERERDRAIFEATRGFERLAVSIGITTEKLRELIESILTARSLGAITSAGGTVQFGHRGLNFGAFEPFIAGEHGLPELVVPTAPGQVISNKELIAALRVALSGQSRGGGNGSSFTIIDNTGNPAATAAAVESRLLFGVNN